MNINIYPLIRPLVFLQDPEKAHERVLKIGEFCQDNNRTEKLREIFNYCDISLECYVNNIYFKNPVGLAAGFDKNGVIPGFIESLGFGFEEIGSVTAKGGKGNEGKRIWRLPKDKALINRMGLNNQGAEDINKNLKIRKSKFPMGVNIAKTHDPNILGDYALADFLDSYRTMTEGDYITLNISCPNTREGKTFEDPDILNELLKEMNKNREYKKDKRPLFVKLSPDLEFNQLDKILQVCEDNDVNGYVVANTSSRRNYILKTSENKIKEIGRGGLSGKPLKLLSSILVNYVYIETKKTIIGAGGIFNAEDAYEKIKAGASLVQIFTGMIYEGPFIAKNINEGLARLLEKDGLNNISKAVGCFGDKMLFGKMFWGR